MLDNYMCKNCGYVYDPKEGDPDTGITPNTEFSDLPPGWECPMCGNDYDNFEFVE